MPQLLCESLAKPQLSACNLLAESLSNLSNRPGYYSTKLVKSSPMPIMRFALYRKDTADIYAVIYEVNPQKFVALNGDDVLTL